MQLSDSLGSFLKLISNYSMIQPDTLNQVAEFHRTFDHPILLVPMIPDEKRCKLRVAFISEELKELEQAIVDKDIVGIADALCDLQYVLTGTVLEFGLGDRFRALFTEVQRSNMSKACDTEQEAKDTVDFYLDESNVMAYYYRRGDKFLVKRVADDKTLKSINYSPANLKRLIEE